MPRARRRELTVMPLLANESLYVGIDVAKQDHVAGFISTTLLKRHERFEACPVLKFANSRDGFRQLIDRIRTYVPLEQVFLLMEQTGHYHKALEQYLLDLDLTVYLIHVQTRPKGLLKTDKRDALTLANHLYNQLDRGIQVADKSQVVRRALPPTEAARQLKSLMRHHYELIHECTQRKNKLIAICDELFPEFTQALKDPTLPSALSLRERFPTPQAIATASLAALAEGRMGTRPSNAQLLHLQALASQSIGTKDVVRQRGLTLEQTQLIHELQLLQSHLEQLETEIKAIVARSREGRILASIPTIGPIQAATLIAVIGNILNFPSSAALKSYLGWAPIDEQTGTSLDRSKLAHTGVRPTKKMLFLIIGNAIQRDNEWARLYERLVPRMCTYNERTRQFVGKKKVIGRLAGQMIKMMYGLLKLDAETVSSLPPGSPLPDPVLYDRAIHQAHRQGHYQAIKQVRPRSKIIQLPKSSF